MRCCGNCANWGAVEDQEGEYRPCEWVRPIMPFWAYISLNDHEDWTLWKDGKSCKAWQEALS